jgi:hypothetical protein
MTPLNFRSGYASTTNVAGIPGSSRPTSASDTAACTCILPRSSAIVNRVGACSDAATVCPTSTLREMTMPLIGETIVVYPRLTRAWL